MQPILQSNYNSGELELECVPGICFSHSSTKISRTGDDKPQTWRGLILQLLNAFSSSAIFSRQNWQEGPAAAETQITKNLPLVEKTNWMAPKVLLCFYYTLLRYYYVIDASWTERNYSEYTHWEKPTLMIRRLHKLFSYTNWNLSTVFIRLSERAYLSCWQLSSK